jgi:hypothetical protein
VDIPLLPYPVNGIFNKECDEFCRLHSKLLPV